MRYTNPRLLYSLSNSAIFNYLQWPLTHISKASGYANLFWNLIDDDYNFDLRGLIFRFWLYDQAEQLLISVLYIITDV